MKKFTLVLVLVLLPAPSFAEPAGEYDDEFKNYIYYDVFMINAKCLKETQDEAARLECLRKTEKKHRAAFNSNYKRMLEHAHNKDILREAQRSWLNWQANQCRYEEIWGGEEGYVRCLLRTTLNREKYFASPQDGSTEETCVDLPGMPCMGDVDILDPNLNSNQETAPDSGPKFYPPDVPERTDIPVMPQSYGAE